MYTGKLTLCGNIDLNKQYCRERYNAMRWYNRKFGESYNVSNFIVLDYVSLPWTDTSQTDVVDYSGTFFWGHFSSFVHTVGDVRFIVNASPVLVPKVNNHDCTQTIGFTSVFIETARENAVLFEGIIIKLVP